MNKTNKIFICSSFVILFFCSHNSVFAEAPDKFEVLLPGNIPLAFQAVYLGIDGEKVFGSKRIKLGSRQEDPGYDAQLVDTLLAGSFTGKRNGRLDWFYYLGKTEVERRQWSAVMRWWDKESGRKSITPEDSSKLPQTGNSLSEIYTFIEALNTWMIKQDKERLPTYRKSRAFCRLPTETEWEFAARGGIVVSPEVFDRPYPTVNANGQQQLGGFEWFSSTSGNRARECGSKHLSANPVGLYDMLGNVAELTLSLFGPEYQHGRFGHYVIRGANFSTDQKDITASVRTEYLTHTKKGDIYRPQKVGFRLALSTRISATDQMNDELDEAYDEYARTKGLTRPGASGKSSPARQSLEDQIERYKEEQKQLKLTNENLEKRLRHRTNEYNRIKKDLVLKNDKVNDLSTVIRQKDQQIATLKKQSVIKEASKKTKSVLESKNRQIERFQNEVLNLKGVISNQKSAVVNIEDMKQELARLKQENKDLKIKTRKSANDIEANISRVRHSEKKLLEAFIRMASYNLFKAYYNLEKIAIKRKNGLPSKTWKLNRLEAEDMLKDYRINIRKMVDHTEASLFKEVKTEIIHWFKDQMVDEKQIQSLDLVERHVKEMRNGRFLKLDELYDSLLTEPEMK